MPHFVTYNTSDGGQGFHICQELDDALREVERLRNTDPCPTDFRLWKAKEIQVKFRTYYVVEVEDEGGAPGVPQTLEPVVAAVADGPAEVVAKLQAADAAVPAQPNEAVPAMDDAEAQEAATFGIFSRP